jgi:TolB-like protein
MALAAHPVHGQGTPAKSPPHPSKDVVAVLEFDAIGASKPQASAVTDRLQDALLKQGRFTLVDRSQIDKILGEQAFQQAGCSSQDCAVQAGKVLGVRHIVTGRVTRIDDGTWQLAGTLIDVESAETLRAETIPHRGDYYSLLNGATVLLAERLGAPLVSRTDAAEENAERACRSDVKSLCGNVEPGGGRIVACLNRNEAKLSPACREARERQRAVAQERNRACRPDVQRLCRDVQPGGGRILACLKQHTADLSDECKRLMP